MLFNTVFPKRIFIFIFTFIMLLPSAAFANSETRTQRNRELPEYYRSECPIQGTVKLNKDSKTGIEINTYLPAGYDPDTQRYDVFMALHQAGIGDLRSWIDANVKNAYVEFPCSQIYDWLIYEKRIPPIIVISINLKQNEDSEEDIRNAVLWAAKNLSTYADEGTFAGIERAREHFFVCGLSMGAWKACSVLQKDFDLFGNYIFGYGGGYYNGDPAWSEYETAIGRKLIKNLIVVCGKEDRSYNSNVVTESLLAKHSDRHMFKAYPGGHGFAAVIPLLYDGLSFIYDDYAYASDKSNRIVHSTAELIQLCAKTEFKKHHILLSEYDKEFLNESSRNFRNYN